MESQSLYQEECLCINV